MKTICPLEISAKISEFCSTISSSKPLYIPVIPEDYSVAGNCYYNVMKKVSYDGGSMQYGWAIWEWPYIMVEAEFHSIWKNHEGESVDVTPNFFGSSRILFLRDPKKEYKFLDGERHNNIRMAVSQHEAVQSFIDVSHAIYEFEEQHSYGMEIRCEGESVGQYKLMLDEKNRLYNFIRSEVAPKPRKRRRIK